MSGYSAAAEYVQSSLDNLAQHHLLGYLAQRLDDKGRLTKRDWEQALTAAERDQSRRRGMSLPPGATS